MGVYCTFVNGVFVIRNLGLEFLGAGKMPYQYMNITSPTLLPSPPYLGECSQSHDRGTLILCLPENMLQSLGVCRIATGVSGCPCGPAPECFLLPVISVPLIPLTWRDKVAKALDFCTQDAYKSPGFEIKCCFSFQLFFFLALPSH